MLNFSLIIVYFSSFESLPVVSELAINQWVPGDMLSQQLEVSISHLVLGLANFIRVETDWDCVIVITAIVALAVPIVLFHYSLVILVFDVVLQFVESGPIVFLPSILVTR